jgi:hypothetical protein
LSSGGIEANPTVLVGGSALMLRSAAPAVRGGFTSSSGPDDRVLVLQLWANSRHSIQRKYQLRASLRLAVGACFYLEENTGDVRR